MADALLSARLHQLRFARSKYLRYDLASQQKMAARGSTNVALEEPSHFTIEGRSARALSSRLPPRFRSRWTD